MNRYARLLGLYIPNDAPPYRWPVWLKYALLLLIGVVPFLVGHLTVSAAALAASVVLLALARVPARIAFGLPLAFWVMVGALDVYHVLITSWEVAARYTLGLVACVYMSRLLTTTTPTGDLMDAVVAAARPLRRLGADPERFGLALAIMWRSIPYLLGAVSDVRAAARARGLRRQAWRLLVPVLIGAIGYALSTGDAVRARGLDGGGQPGG